MSQNAKVKVDNGGLLRDLIDSDLVGKGRGGESTDEAVLKKGPWTSTEDAILVDYVKKHGEGNWNAVQKNSGLSRCGKSCRLRWANHLRPNLKKGAFSIEEESLIFELQAKMGNKWARMAALLPGRTDNEIKNYWNTRIKRRLRAGLPLHPVEGCMQAVAGEDQQNPSFHEINTANMGFLPSCGYHSPDVVFEGLNAGQGFLSCISEHDEVSTSSLRMNCLEPTQFGSRMPCMINYQRGSISQYSSFSGKSEDLFSFLNPCDDDRDEKIIGSFGHSFSFDQDPADKNLLPTFHVQGSHSFSNGNSSSSRRTALKLELPSFQASEAELNSMWISSASNQTLLESVDPLIQSLPRSPKVESEYLSPQNNGLLEVLVYEATQSSTKNQSHDKGSNSFAQTPGDTGGSSLDFCETQFDEYRDPISPLGQSETSIFNDYRVSASGSSHGYQPHADAFPVLGLKEDGLNQFESREREQETPTESIYTWPDALLASSDWFGQRYGPFTCETPISDSMAFLVGYDLTGDYKRTAEA
ncbi:hypothetical protein SAY87_012531 [Trapa incisa]|uniref:Transcription factor GAMYB n=1 Tax=Trapa incisa TaxID=236973 RepID=A0AAN7GXZ3_9MYRT|nr:hypothetical protein SAY87_012531 [Trapa incisa]